MAPGKKKAAKTTQRASAAKQEALQKEVDELRAKSEEYLDMARRARADFENYQKRVARDRQEWSRQAVEKFVAEFLPALDGLAAAKFEDAQLTEAIRLIERDLGARSGAATALTSPSLALPSGAGDRAGSGDEPHSGASSLTAPRRRPAPPERCGPAPGRSVSRSASRYAGRRRCSSLNRAAKPRA